MEVILYSTWDSPIQPQKLFPKRRPDGWFLARLLLKNEVCTKVATFSIFSGSCQKVWRERKPKTAVDFGAKNSLWKFTTEKWLQAFCFLNAWFRWSWTFFAPTGDDWFSNRLWEKREGSMGISCQRSNSFVFFVLVHLICVLWQDLESAEMEEIDSETTLRRVL